MKKFLLITATVFLMQVCNAQTGSFDYFGQAPPGDSAVIFAPGLISLNGRDEISISFSPAVDELCLSVYSSNCDGNGYCPGSVIFYSKKTGSTWSKLDTAYFAPKSSFNAIFSPDSQLITFVYQGGTNDSWGNIYYCNRTDTGWSQSKIFPTIISSTFREGGHALTLDGTFYFTSGRPVAGNGGDVYKANRINGTYSSAEYVPNLSTPFDEDAVWVSSDESYAIVESWQDANQKDLYISFHKQDSSWTKLKNMGPKINTSGQEYKGRVTSDGKYLFFANDRSGNADIYWIRVDKIIKNLKISAFAPKLNKQIPALSIKTDTIFNYVIPVNTFSCDYGTETLKYKATLRNGSALPSWLSFNADTRTLSGTPNVPETDTIKITATNADTVSASCQFKITVVAGPTGVEGDKDQLPKDFGLQQNYPNPFNPATTIQYSLSKPSQVKMSIYNLLGQNIRTLQDSFQSAGEHSLVWDAMDEKNNPVSSGMYFYRLEAGAINLQKKMILLK